MLGSFYFDKKLYLDALELPDLETIKSWRNKLYGDGVLRTNFLETSSVQEEFYFEVISNKASLHRFFAVKEKETKKLIGMSGLTNIQWENRLFEISLMTNPDKVGLGFGEKSLVLTLKAGFCLLGLCNAFGECYKCNPNILFWEKMITRYNGYSTILPNRKFFNGKLYDSLYFNFQSEKFMKN